MILDRLAHAERYRGLHPRLAAGLDWLLRQDWNELADGRLAICGDELAAIIESGSTAAPETRRYESHQRHLDIQYSIAGGERIGWCAAADLPPGAQEGPDIWFHPLPDAAQDLVVAPGSFAIFAPGEGHRPCCHLAGRTAAFRKCVVKVAWP